MIRSLLLPVSQAAGISTETETLEVVMTDEETIEIHSHLRDAISIVDQHHHPLQETGINHEMTIVEVEMMIAEVEEGLMIAEIVTEVALGVRTEAVSEIGGTMIKIGDEVEAPDAIGRC